VIAITGLSRNLVDGAGALLTGTDHLRQSIIDILTTPIATRVMRPEYGSRLFELIDRPVDAEFLVDLYAETVIALHRWEPRIRVVRVRADEVTPGQVILDLTVVLTLDGTPQQVNGVVVRLRELAA